MTLRELYDATVANRYDKGQIDHAEGYDRKADAGTTAAQLTNEFQALDIAFAEALSSIASKVRAY